MQPSEHSMTVRDHVTYWGACLKDVRFAQDIHDNYELIYVSSGVLLVTEQMRSVRLEAGMAMLLFPNSFHQTETIGESVVYNFQFLKKHVPFFNTEIEGKLPEKACYHPDETVIRLVYDNAIARPCEDEVRLSAYAALVCADFLNHNTLVKAEGGQNSAILNHALTYMRQHYREPLTVESVARAVSTNKNYLSRLMSASGRIGFRGYLKAYRLEEARILVETTDEPIAKIAARVGYVRQKSFFADFRERFGTSPAVLRKNGQTGKKEIDALYRACN